MGRARNVERERQVTFARLFAEDDTLLIPAVEPDWSLAGGPGPDGRRAVLLLRGHALPARPLPRRATPGQLRAARGRPRGRLRLRLCAELRLLRDKRFLAKLSLPGRFLFLFRLRFGLYAVLSRLGAVAGWGALESRWAAEARQRGGASL